MQAISRRGFSSIFSAPSLSRSILPRARHSPLRNLQRVPATTRLVLTSQIHCSQIRRASSTATATATAESSSPSDHDENGLITRFEALGSRGLVNQRVIDTITQKMQLETMTAVQSQTINEALQGADTLGIARTGTGKTVAFLLPVIQRILNDRPELARPQRRNKIEVQSLIISPTRELAEQIAKEAKRMVADTGIQVGLAVGGTGKAFSLRNMHTNGCHILVGTPGRLNDLLSDSMAGITAPGLSTLVLDEADRLLDDGFGPSIEEIYTRLPSKMVADRQTFMFSATMEPEVMGMVRKFMKKDFCTVRTIPKGHIQTHENVPQRAVVALGLENQLPALFELIKREHGADSKFKAVVFFNTTAQATLAYETWLRSSLQQTTRLTGSVMHSRLSQPKRTTTSDAFRRATTAILFASDVAARGMDFPDVTHVIQMGMPKDRDTYIHRVGRTGRAGKEGQGWLILTPWDRQDYLRKLRDLPIEQDKSLATASTDMTQASSIAQATANILTDVKQAAKMVNFKSKSDAFRSSLSSGQTLDKLVLIKALNRLSQYGWGLDPPPAVDERLARKLGFVHIREMNIGHDDRNPPIEESGAVGRRSERSGFGNRGSRGGFSAGDRYADRGSRESFGGPSDSMERRATRRGIGSGEGHRSRARSGMRSIRDHGA